MKIKSHEIGFDLDGVIAETGETFLRLACEEFGHCSFSLEDIKDWRTRGRLVAITTYQGEERYTSDSFDDIMEQRDCDCY